MIIYVGIDGTGPEWWSGDPQYEQDFADSHVNFLSKNWVSNDTFYHRGATITGRESGKHAETAYRETIERVNKYGENTPIVLAGYSRGGSSVIDAALHLKEKDNVSVDILILFDPVDRSFMTGGFFRNTPIPDTVKNVVYAQRDPRAGSRETFSNCGTKYEDRSKVKLYPKKFYGTHGALGGCPWKIPDGKTERDFIAESPPDGLTLVRYGEDPPIAALVRGWMWGIVSDLLIEIVEERKAPIGIPTQIPGNSDFGSSLPLTGRVKTHVVKQGDWLSKIAMTYYGDMHRWKIIYDHPKNRKTIGPDPNLIKPGDVLIIP